MWSKLLRGAERFVMFGGTIGMIAVVGAFLLILADITGRIISHTFEGTSLIIPLLLSAIAFMSLGYAQLHGSHVSVDSIIVRLSAKVQNIFYICILLVIMGATGFMTVQIGQELYRTWARNLVRTETYVNIPLWPNYLFTFLGCVIFIIAFAVQIAHNIAGLKANRAIGMRTTQ